MSRAMLAKVACCDVSGVRVATKGVTEARVRRTVFRILEDNMLCSISTVTGGGRAHISTAYFCFSTGLELYFLSHPSSLHCHNLSANSSVGMAVFSASQRWVDPGRGLQLFGTCSRARGAHARRAEALYGKRFAAYARWKATLTSSDSAREYRFYRFVTKRLKVLDERDLGDAVFVYAAVKRTSASA